MNAPDKCPKCGAGVWIGGEECTIWLCGSDEDEQTIVCVSIERDQLAARVKRLEEAGDAMDPSCNDRVAVDAWRKAKEASHD